MTKKILPCPFCGEEAEIVYSNDNHHQPHVQCNTLHCPGNKTYQWHYKTVDEAVEAWNARAGKQTVAVRIGSENNGFCICKECNAHLKWAQSYCGNCGLKVDWSYI